MAKYYVCYNDMENQVASIQSVGKMLTGAESRLNSITNKMDVRDSSMASLKLQVRNCGKSVSSLANRMISMSDTVLQINRIYEKAEKDCFNKLDESMISMATSLAETVSTLGGVVIGTSTGSILLKAPGLHAGSVIAKLAKRQRKKAWYEKIGDVIPDAIINTGRKMYNAGKGAVENWKQGVSYIRKSIEPGGSLYRAWTIGKCAVGMTKGIVGMFGSIVAFGAGVAPLGVLGSIYSANKLANSTKDMMYAIEGKYDRIGKTNYLKDKLKESSTIVTGNDDLGEIIYGSGEIITAIGAIEKGFKYLVKKVNKINFSEVPAQAANVLGFTKDTLGTSIDLNTIERIKYNYKLLSFTIPDFSKAYDEAQQFKKILKGCKKIFTVSERVTQEVLAD